MKVWDRLSACALCIVMMALGILATLAPAQGEALYRCDGAVPLYTNDASSGCPVYEPRSRLSRAPRGATWADVKAIASEVERRPAVANPPAGCAEYREWNELNTRTQGGTINQTTEDRQRFQALQKQFGLPGAPSGC